MKYGVTGGLIIVSLLLAGCGEPTNTPAKQSAGAVKEMTLEQKFIAASTGTAPSIDDASVKRAKELIDRAAGEYGVSREEVANQAYKAGEVARGDGIQATALEVLEAVTLAYVPSSGADFSQMAAMYITVRKGGMAHAESMMGLKGLITRMMELGDVKRR